MKRQEIRGWFPQSHEDHLNSLMERFDVQTVIEIGSFLGKSTAFFAERAKVIAIDPFVIWKDFIDDKQPLDGLDEDFYEQFKSNMEELDLMDKIITIRTKSSDAFINFPELGADLIYIDGDHSYEGAKQDILLWIQRANKIICGDDYGDHWPGIRDALKDLGIDVNVEVNGFWWKEIKKI